MRLAKSCWRAPQLIRRVVRHRTGTRNMRRALTAVILAWCCTQCVSGTGQPPGLPYMGPPPTSPHPECAAEREKARAHPETPGIVPAVLGGIVLPPPDTPAEVRGTTVLVYLLVDENGTVIRDSTSTPFTRYKSFAREFSRRLRGASFQPALYNGCSVASWFSLRITL